MLVIWFFGYYLLRIRAKAVIFEEGDLRNTHLVPRKMFKFYLKLFPSISSSQILSNWVELDPRGASFLVIKSQTHLALV